MEKINWGMTLVEYQLAHTLLFLSRSFSSHEDAFPDQMDYIAADSFDVLLLSLKVQHSMHHEFFGLEMIRHTLGSQVPNPARRSNALGCFFL